MQVKCSTRSGGDFHRTEVAFDELEARRRRFVDLPWTQLDQVHGTTIRRVDTPAAPMGHSVTSPSRTSTMWCWVVGSAIVPRWY